MSSWLLARRADQLPDLEFADRRLRRGLLFFALLLVTGVLVRAVGADVSSVGGGCLLIAFIIALTTQHLRRREIREGRVLLRRVDGRHKPESRSFTVPRSMWEDRRNAAKPTASPSS